MQAVGQVEGVEKRVDVVSMAMQMSGTVYDLEEAELCYAPQYGSAKDAVNFAGMVACNVLRGDMPVRGCASVASFLPLSLSIYHLFTSRGDSALYACSQT